MHHALRRRGVIGVIVRYAPILDHVHEHDTGLPPGAIEFTGRLTGLVALVVVHHAPGGRGSGIPKGFFIFISKS